MQSSRPVRRADGARTLVANRSTKICRPHNTASHRKRRAMTTNSTLLPDSGRSPTRRWYRLCTRRRYLADSQLEGDEQRRSAVAFVVVAVADHSAVISIGRRPKVFGQTAQARSAATATPTHHSNNTARVPASALSGDLRYAPIEFILFFLRVGKVGLEPIPLTGSRPLLDLSDIEGGAVVWCNSRVRLVTN